MVGKFALWLIVSSRWLRLVRPSSIWINKNSLEKLC